MQVHIIPCSPTSKSCCVCAGEWRRGYVEKRKEDMKLALVHHLDFEDQSSKVKYDMIKPLVPRFGEPPCQAIPICQMLDIEDGSTKYAMLRPYMHLAIQIEVSVLLNKSCLQ